MGYLYKYRDNRLYINRQLSLTIFTTLMGISTALMPHSFQLWHYYLCILGYGFGFGVHNGVHYVWLIEIWQQNCAPVLQIMQLMFGIGTILGPLLDKPYLTGEIQHKSNNSLNFNSTFNLINVNTEIERRNKLQIPFHVTGILQIIGINIVVFYS